MFIYDTMSQGLELLARRELQDAENLFLSVINDPYSQPEETKQAKQYLNDIRDCKKGYKTLNFDHYRDLVKKVVVSLDYVDELIADIYCSPAGSYAPAGASHGAQQGPNVLHDGLEYTNNLARERAIIVHGADYADPAFLAREGKLGRSYGCFSTAHTDLPMLRERMGEGRLLFAYA